MKGFPTQEQVQRIREQYPIGTEIVLDGMENERDMPPGLSGTVEMVDDAGQLHMSWSNGRSLALIPGEDRFHIAPSEEATSGTERFIDYINEHILPHIDYRLLDNSYRTEDKAYAKGILNLLHTAMVEQYGGKTLTPQYRSMDEDYVVIPGVIEGKKTGQIALALLGFDLASSGEHCQTDVLCRHGVIAQQGSNHLPPYVTADIHASFIPYEYGYTANIPGDIHVSKNKLPDGIRDMLDTFQNFTAQLLPSNEVAETVEDDMER